MINLSIFLEGVKFTACPIFISCIIIVILFYIFVSRSFPLPSAFLSTDIERGKVFGLNTLRRRKIPTETDEQRKGANDGIGILIYRRLMIDQIKYYPAIMKNAPSFCSFIKKLYLCIRMSYTSRNLCKHVEIRTVANSLPRFLTIRTTNLISADY